MAAFCRTPATPSTTDTSSSTTRSGSTTRSPAPTRLANFDEEDLSEPAENLYLSVCYGAGKLGAAFYDTYTSVLYVVNDVMDQGPKYARLRNLFAQIHPQHVIVSNRQSSDLKSVIRELCGNAKNVSDDQEESNLRATDESGDSVARNLLTSDLETSPDQTDPTPNNAESRTETGQVEFHQIPAKNFGYPSCMRRILNLRLPGQPDTLTESDYRVYISGLVDFNLECVVRAAGALLHYLDEFGIGVANLDDDDGGIGSGGATIVLAVQPFVPRDIVGIEETTLAALQIFNTSWKPAASRVGSWNQQREGLSLFNILNRCKSVNGVKYLRYICRTIPRDLNVITSRQNAIAYFSRPTNIDVVKSLQDCLRNIKSLHRVLKKLASNQTAVRDWKCLKSTLLNMMLLAEICARKVSLLEDCEVEILEKLASKSTSVKFRTMVNIFDRVFDPEASEARNRFTVLPGVCKVLDERRRVHNGLPDLLYQVVQREIEELPEEMQECSMIYVPNIGYMLAIKPWCVNGQLVTEFTHLEGLRFIFKSAGIPHYKSKRCEEMDENLGDTATDIATRETAFMVHLTDVILSNTDLLLEISRLASELDALLSLSIVALERDWVRPNIVQTFPPQPININGGRHPLQELGTISFVSNPTYMGDRGEINAGDGKMVLLTGPNACGKSVYLKQVGLIAYLAHLGSYVPAVSADLPLLSSIFSRIQTLDSLELGLSAFAVDLNQMSLALRGANESSLILIDEFGKGTSQADGLALLAASIEFWIQKGPKCPFVIVSTHFQAIKGLLPKDNPVLTYKTFAHEFHGHDLVHLYRLVDGIGVSSQALHAAAQGGVQRPTLDRAFKVLKFVAEGKSIPLPKSMYPMGTYQEICEEFLDLDFDSDDFESRMSSIMDKLRKTSK